MAKKVMNALLIEYDEIRYHQGVVYFYNDLEQFMTNLLLGGAWWCLNQKSIDEFRKALAQGRIKIGVAGTNHNSGKDTIRFSDVANGQCFVNHIIKKNSVKEDYYIMDANKRQTLSHYGVHCPIESVRQPNIKELDIIHKTMEKCCGQTNVDSVFNLFGVLCCSKNMFGNANETRGSAMLDQQILIDKRNRTFLFFDTFREFDKKQSKIKTEACKSIAENAYKITTALTGYELYIKSNPKLNFVDALMSSRILVNDDVEIRQVSKPTLTLKEFFEIGLGEKDEPQYNISAKLLLDSFIESNNTTLLQDCLTIDNITVVKLNYCVDDVKAEQFKGIENCIVWRVDKKNGNNVFFLYLWGTTETVYNMVGDNIKTFLKVIKSK